MARISANVNGLSDTTPAPPLLALGGSGNPRGKSVAESGNTSNLPGPFNLLYNFFFNGRRHLINFFTIKTVL